MTLISIDTATSACSAALTVGGMPIATRLNTADGNHAGLLPTYVNELLQEAAARSLRVEAIVLSEGPGSYTGLRIATATAKGLCYGLEIPLIVIPTTLLLAAACAGKAIEGSKSEVESWLCPMIDARRMEVYTALYDMNLKAQTDIHALVVDSDSFAAMLSDRPIVFFGDGAMKCQSVIHSPNAHFVDGIVPDAQYLGLLAENGFGRKLEGKEIAYYEPYYLKEFVAAPAHVKGLV